MLKKPVKQAKVVASTSDKTSLGRRLFNEVMQQNPSIAAKINVINIERMAESEDEESSSSSCSSLSLLCCF